MSVFGVRTATAFGRAACAVTLLFLFFLPLHVHFSLSPQLSNQCSCLQGARAQYVVADEAPALCRCRNLGFWLNRKFARGFLPHRTASMSVVRLSR